MTQHQGPRAIQRDDRALLLVPEPLRLSAFEEGGGGTWNSDDTRDVELHLSADDYRALLRQAPGEIHDFLTWLVALDDPDPESEGFQTRRTTTMSDIIRRARKALGEEQ